MSGIKDINKKEKDIKFNMKTYLEENNNNNKSNNNSYFKSYYKMESKNKNNFHIITDNNKKRDIINHRLYKKVKLDNISNGPIKIIDVNGFNTSSNISNLNTQINTNTKRAFENMKKKHLNDSNDIINNINNQIIPINNIKTFNFSKKKTSSENKNNLKQILKKNTISYVDRKKIKKLNSTTLKLYEIYMERKNQALRNREYTENNNESFFNSKNQYNDNFISENLNNYNNNTLIQKNNLKNISINSSSIDSDDSPIFKNKIKKNLKKFKTQRKYGLKQLMNFNPYHYVSSMVRYCNSIEMKNISEKLSTVSGAMFNRKATSKQLFFKNENNIKRKNKVINTISVSMNNNLSFKGEFVWRILEKMTKTNGFSSFYNSCKFKGYYELWKHYSIIIEQLLVKYVEFKWFLEKTKYMKEDVFREFLICLKISVKNNNSFCNKVFLLFDQNCTKEINIKEFFFIMELISKSSNEIEKIHFYCELLSDIKLKNEKNCINVMEMFEIFKKIINSPSYKKECKCLYEILKKEFNDGKKIDNNLYINKKQLMYFMLNNKYFQRIIQLFKFQYKHADILYNDEINSSFNSTVRNVKKFLNEQNETIKMSINECDNLETILKAIKDKEQSKNIINNLESEFHNNLNDE